MRPLGNKNVNFALNAGPDLQFLVNLPNTYIQEIKSKYTDRRLPQMTTVGYTDNLIASTSSSASCQHSHIKTNRPLGNKNVNFALNAGPDLQFLVNLPNTCIQEIICVGQLTGIFNVEDIIHHDQRSCSFRHVRAVADLRPLKVHRQTVATDDDCWVYRQSESIDVIISILPTQPY